MTRLVTRPGKRLATRPAGRQPENPPENAHENRRVSRRAVVLTVAAVAVGAAGGGWAYGYGPLARGLRAAAPPQVPMSTAVVRLGTLAVRADDAGTIGYANAVTVYAAMAGTLTWLPDTGAVIRPGHRLFAVDGQDVLLLRGGTPAWRAFTPGMSDGPDVSELQRNLIALGYDPEGTITVDGIYGWATQAAVERWQAALGLTEDAQIPLGEVMFLPAAVRVSQPLSGPGATVAAGTPVLAATSTAPVVTVSLPAGEQYQVRPGERVDITLPDGSFAPGRVLSVSAAMSSSTSGPVGSSGQGQGQGQGQAQGQAQASVVVSVDRPIADLNGASVQVAITTQVQPDALIVPVSALLAAPGGGYQVTVVTGRTTRNITVTPGPFDDLDGLVAISGPGIAPGTTVEVPSS
jgi:peptidoglycan hydrolase-like protein with peptidoglycan-binding domain